jgi:hypothetical protein
MSCDRILDDSQKPLRAIRGSNREFVQKLDYDPLDSTRVRPTHESTEALKRPGNSTGRIDFNQDILRERLGRGEYRLTFQVCM